MHALIDKKLFAGAYGIRLTDAKVTMKLLIIKIPFWPHTGKAKNIKSIRTIMVIIPSNLYGDTNIFFVF